MNRKRILKLIEKHCKNCRARDGEYCKSGCHLMELKDGIDPTYEKKKMTSAQLNNLVIAREKRKHDKIEMDNKNRWNKIDIKVKSLIEVMKKESNKKLSKIDAISCLVVEGKLNEEDKEFYLSNEGNQD